MIDIIILLSKLETIRDFVMIKSFYKYAINRYLGHSLTNFVCEKFIWMICICASMSIKIEFGMLHV